MFKLSAALTLALVALAAMPLTAAPKKAAKPAAKTAAARPLPTEFMGVEIGSTFSMPECSTEDRGYGLPKSYAFEDKQAVRPCWNALAPDGDYGRPKGENYTVEFMPPAGKRPPGVVTSSALVVNGKIEGVSFITNGLESQDSILSALTGKLGTPTQLKETPMQNRMGATFTSQEAEWAFKGGKGAFNGMVGKIDQGIGYVYTAAGSEYVEADYNARHQNSF
jgi:hypothetical protein